MSKINKTDIVNALKEMTMLEIKELIETIEKEFGVSAAAPVAATATAQVVEAPTEVNLMLISSGEQKVGVIKVVREITGLGLMDAKALVDSAPKAIKEGIKPEEAAELKKKFEGTTATIEIK
ncbi:MAG: 50S ribosomal protein L7/L12 [Mycoplasmoidaceae bacterium]